MKKVLLMFAFIATLLVGSIGTAGAQVNHTVYDGTATSTYVPVEGLYTDSRLKCEYVIPADHLTAINGSTISKLTYYLTSSATAAWTCNFQVFVKEVASSTISSFSGMEDATLVYEGTLDATSSTMEVVFSTPYTYNGGNLLIGFYNTNTGNYKSATFAGQTITGASVQGHNSNFSSITATQKNFIPKTTFTVDELHGCLTPTNLAVSDITPYGATVTWTPGNTETAWVVKFNDLEFSTTTPSYTATTLAPNTDYVASVKAVCGDTEESEYTTPGALFTTLPTCPAPTAVTVSNVTTTSADIAWTNGGDENAWTIDYNGTEVSATTNPFPLTGLNPSTNYTVKVKANCDVDDESDWSPIATFATACDAFTLTETEPYSENFDSYEAVYQGNIGVIPNCWSVISNGTSVSALPCVSTSYAPTSGNNGFNFRSGGSTYANCGTTNIACLPEFTNPQGANVTFTYRMESNNNGALSVGYVTDVDDINSFVFVSSVTSSTSAANAEIIIPSSIPAGARIALCWVETSTSYYDCGIDNLVVSMAPACSKPTAVTVSNITAHTADIAWTENGTTNEWVIDCNGTEITATTNPFTLTGLNAATSYTVKVKAVCSEEDESDWSSTASFATTCEIVVVTEANPFTEDFNTLTSGIPACWDNEEGTVTTASYRWNYYATGVTGACVRFNSFNATANQYSLLKTPALDLTAISNPMLTFTHKNPSAAGGFDVMYTTDGGATYTTIATGLQGASAWTTEEIVVSALANTENVMFVFKGVSNYGYGDDYIYLDDVMIGAAPTCPKPTAVTVSNITPHTADIAWTENGTTNEWLILLDTIEIPADSNPFTLTGLTSETSYTVSVKAICSEEDESDWSATANFTTAISCPRPTAVTVDNITETTAEIAWTDGGDENAWIIDLNGTEIPADSNPFLLTGLSNSTEYTVKVKAVCGEGDESQWSTATNFATECGTFMVTETTPYTQGFESTTFPPTCWSRNHTAGTSTNTWIRTTSSTYVHQGTGAAQLQDQQTDNRNDLVTALLNIPEANTYQVDFWMYRSTYSSLKPNEGVKVWVNTTPDTLGATEIAYIHREYTLTPAETATGWHEYSAVIPTSGDMYVIFQGISEYGAASYIDDITVNKAPSCLKPIDVTVSNITETTAEISWTEQGTTNEWTIMLDSTEISATTNPFTLTNLTAATNYTVKVKAICSEEEESDWSSEVSFRTECAVVTVPFYESFEENDLGCWTVEEDNTSYTWHIVSSLSSGYSGGMADGQYAAAMTCSSSATQYTAKLISPVLDLSTTLGPVLTFSYLNALWSPDQNVLSVYYRTDANAEWTLLETYNSNVTSWTEETISLPNPTATYQIAFEGETHYGRNIHVDAISVEGTSCPTPTNVVVSNETETSADVNWTAGYEETAWNIRYREIHEPIATFDFEEDLQGWTTLNTDGDEYVFVHSSENIAEYDYSSLGHNGSNGFAVSNSFIDDMDAVNVNQYFVAPNAITVGSATTVVFHYDYGNDTYPDYFEAGIFTQDPTDATNFTSLWNSGSRSAANAVNANVRHTEPTRFENWREVTIDLSEYAGQQVWIAFHHQDYDNYELWLDDITIGELPDEWTVVEGVTNPYTIEGLTANTTYEVQVQAACSEDDASAWTASVEFTTLGDSSVVEPCEVPANIAVEHNVVTWESEAANFNIMIVANGDTTNATAAGNTYTVEGLENGTEVVVLVQAICDEDNLSDWTEGFTFTYENTGINNYSINAKVYPNPTTGLINVDCAAINADVTVYDMFGKLMMTSKIANERTELDFSAFAPGMYIVRIADANNSTNVKVVKK